MGLRVAVTLSCPLYPVALAQQCLDDAGGKPIGGVEP
jgi:hypothetical protein